MLLWIEPGWRPTHGGTGEWESESPGFWRQVKIWCGLLRHPNRAIRRAGCEQLLHLGRWAQDECLNQFSPQDRAQLIRHFNVIQPEQSWREIRVLQPAAERWRWLLGAPKLDRGHLDELRTYTEISIRGLRERFRLDFQRRFPKDRESGCPADPTPPATIATANRDVPLLGEWLHRTKEGWGGGKGGEVVGLTELESVTSTVSR